MVHFLHWLIGILGSVTAIIAFLELLIGDTGEAALKEQLLKWYVYIGDHKLRNIITSSATMLDTVLRRTFGTRWYTATWRWLLFSTCLSVPLLFYVLSTFEDSEAAIAYIGTIIIVGAIFALLDLPFFLASRFLIHRLATSLRHHAFLLLGYLLTASIALALLTASWLLFFVVALGTAASSDPNAYIDPNYSIDPKVIAPVIKLGAISVFIGLSTLLLAPVILGATVVYIFRPIMEPLALWMIEGLASSKKGVLSAISTGVTVFVGLLSIIPGVKGS